MKISRDNYEVWFIDHFDGNLSPEQEKELSTFLVLNADLQEEFDSFEPVTLEESMLKFSGKSGLKKQIKAEDQENYFISYTEQLLTPSEKVLVEEHVQGDPKSKKELDLFFKTRLPAEAIVFPHKHNLYRKETRIVPLYYRVAIAATLVMLIGAVGLLNYSGDTSKGMGIADQHSHSFPLLAIKKQTPEVKEVKQEQRSFAPVNVGSPTVASMPYMTLIPPSPLPTDLNKADAFIRPLVYPADAFTMNKNPDEDAVDPTLGQLFTSKLRNTINKNTDEEQVKGRLRWWEVVNAVGKGLSSLTGKPFKMDKKLDENGKLMAYRIDYGDYTIEKEMKP